MTKYVRPYECPRVQYWMAEELNAIVATMSGGSGGSDPLPYNVFVILNRTAAMNQGHIAILLGRKGGVLQEYSYCGINSILPVQDGRVVTLKYGFTLTFNSFIANNGWVTHGSLDNNDYWDERYTDCIAMQVTTASYSAIRDYGATILNNPGTYNLATNNCLHFTLNALAAGGIKLLDSAGNRISGTVPNSAFDAAVDVYGGAKFGSWKYVL